MANPQDARQPWTRRRVWPNLPVTWGHVAFGLILAFVVLTRLANLGQRVQSHDESLHTYFSWQLYKGRGFQHTPLMHGPLQFHLMALSYFLFGDNDFTARLPHALAGILAVFFLWKWRRYLGDFGTLAGAFLMLISPYILYYSRYARNEALVMLFAVTSWWAILRYLETRETRYLYWLTVSLVLHYTAKETAFIYTAQALIFLALLTLDIVTRTPWARPGLRNLFLILLALALLSASAAVFVMAVERRTPAPPPQPTTPILPEAPPPLTPPPPSPFAPLRTLFLGLSGVSLLLAVVVLFLGYDWKRLRHIPAVELIYLQFSLTLPMLAPFPLFFLNIRVGEYRPELLRMPTVAYIAAAVIATIVFALLLGWLWDFRRWWKQALVFWSIFLVFYTTMFTNGLGVFTGLLGSLGYWLEQQGVRRGNQPWYYYIVVQIPIYEYLPFLGMVLAGVHQILRGLKQRLARARVVPGLEAPEDAAPETPAAEEDTWPRYSLRGLAFTFLFFWSLTSILAYTIAGEKMPWLTVHITLPMILLTAWWLDDLFRGLGRVRWQDVLVLAVAVLTLLLSVPQLVAPYLFDLTRPFSGKDLDALQASTTFVVALVMTGAALVVLVRVARRMPARAFWRGVAVAFFGLMALFTWHTAYQATYVNYDQANEFLVYAHSAHGVRVTMNAIERIARTVYDSNEVPIAYDNATSWPFSWYLRNYPKAQYFAASPDPGLAEKAVVLAGPANWASVEAYLGDRFYTFEYNRMVWPHEDIYRGLTWEKIRTFFKDPTMRRALWQIWLNRDFTLYAQARGEDLSLARWSPADRMRVYIRKDIAAQVWNTLIGPEAAQAQVAFQEILTPETELDLQPLMQIGGPGAEEGLFQGPRDVAVAPDGTLYVADTFNHRIQHLTPTGEVVNVWGGLTPPEAQPLPVGTFREPWGIAVGPDGRVYVADTWNHRIQVFDAEGNFLTQWGAFGQGGNPYDLWGPRDVVVDRDGYVIVSDTGNKRLLVFTPDGQFVEQIGGGGTGPGQFNEPVGLAIGPDGTLYVADTWNGRIQAFRSLGQGAYVFSHMWDVPGWKNEHLENKPYLAVDEQGRVLATIPMRQTVVIFDDQGQVQFWWRVFTPPEGAIGVVNGVAVDAAGTIWIADAFNSVLWGFPLPTVDGEE